MLELKSYMELRREYDRKMKREFVIGAIIVVLSFALMIIAINLWGG